MSSSPIFPEDLEVWIDPSLLNGVVSDARRLAREKRAEVALEEAEYVRSKVEPRRIREVEAGKYDVYSVDSSYVSPPMELVGGVLTILTYGYVGVVNGVYDRWMSGSIVFEDVGDFERSISRIALIKEREVAIKLLQRKARGSTKVDVLILDGEIPIHPLPYNLASEEGKYRRVNYVVGKLLEQALKTKTTIVGVVKRVRSKLFSLILGRCSSVNDKVIASMILEEGSYVVLGAYREILPKWVEMNYAYCDAKRFNVRAEDVLACAREGRRSEGVVEKLCRRILEGLDNVERVLNSSEHPALRYLGDVSIAFYKAPRTSLATKVEVLDFGGHGVDEIVSFLASITSPTTGYPVILDVVDSYVRARPELLNYALNLLIKESDEVGGRILPLLLQLTNSQKSYLYPLRPIK